MPFVSSKDHPQEFRFAELRIDNHFQEFFIISKDIYLYILTYVGTKAKGGRVPKAMRDSMVQIME